MEPKVDEFIKKHGNFSSILLEIRRVLFSTELVETIKWGMPTYTINNKNVAGIGSFKSHCGVWFFQGALLKDTYKVLHNAQEGKTKAMRQWRFTKDSTIDTELLHLYIQEAIVNEKKGLKIKPVKKPLVVPSELKILFAKNEVLAELFNALTLTKKREFSEYIYEAKRAETKAKRIEKIIPLIENSIGLHDNYKNC